MKYNDAINLTEENAKKCYDYFKSILGKSGAYFMASNRANVAMKDPDLKIGDDFYEGKTRAEFIRELGQMVINTDPKERNKIITFYRAYQQTAPEDGTKIIRADYDKDGKKAAFKAKTKADNSILKFNNKEGIFYNTEKSSK